MSPFAPHIPDFMAFIQPFNIARFDNTQQTRRKGMVIKIPPALWARGHSQNPIALGSQIIKRFYIPAFSEIASTFDFKFNPCFLKNQFQIYIFFFKFSLFMFQHVHVFASGLLLLAVQYLGAVFVFKTSWFSSNFIKLNKRTVLISWVHWHYIMSSALCRFFSVSIWKQCSGLSVLMATSYGESTRKRRDLGAALLLGDAVLFISLCFLFAGGHLLFWTVLRTASCHIKKNS